MRQRVLRRYAYLNSTADTSDLWMTYLVLVESNALNEVHLQTAGVGDWVLGVLHECHSQAMSESDERVLALTVSEACLVPSVIHIQILYREPRF